MIEFSDQSNSLKFLLEMMTGNDAIFEAHALLYVVISKVDKYVSYGELVGTRECITL
jgi:hypothetical protein